MTDVVTLFYNETLDATVPDIDDFEVVVNGSPATVLDVTVDDSRVLLTLDTVIVEGDDATVTYLAGSSMVPIQDPDGNPAAPFDDEPVVITAAPGSFTGFGFALGGAYPYASTGDRQREADDSAAAGSRWLRFNCDWSHVQAGGSGSFDWTTTDNAVADAIASGQNVLMGIGFAPAWANGGHSDDKYPPVDPDDFGNFAGAVANRYAGDVPVFEGWNEPNLSSFWKPAPDATAYAALMAAAYPQLKANGAQMVLAGATSPAGDSSNPLWQGNFLQDFLDAGGGANMDGWSHHPYPGNELPSAQDGPWGYGSVFANVEAGGTLRSILDAEGLSAIPIWGTEFGVSIAAPDNVTQLRQAEIIQDGMQDWFANAAANNLGPLLVYAYHNPILSTIGYNVTNSDWSARPALVAFSNTVGIWP